VHISVPLHRHSYLRHEVIKFVSCVKAHDWHVVEVIDNTRAHLVHRTDLTVRPKVGHHVLLRGSGGLCERLKTNQPTPYSEYNMFPAVWIYMEGFKNGGK